MATPTAEQEIAPATAERCSKCPEILDTTGTPKWCRACRAKYKREYDALRKEIFEGRGVQTGMRAMQDYLAAQFERYGSSGSFTGYEIANLIRQAKGPQHT